jgi:hypothetical protein
MDFNVILNKIDGYLTNSTKKLLAIRLIDIIKKKTFVNEKESQFILKIVRRTMFNSNIFLKTPFKLNYRNFLRAIFTKLTVHFTEIIRKYSALRLNLMITDDSFVFSNLLYQIKLELNALPNVTQEEKLNYNSIIKTFRCNIHVMKNTYFVRMVQHIFSHAFQKKENIFSFYPNLNYSRNATTICEDRKMNKFPKDRLAIKSQFTVSLSNETKLTLYRREYILELLESLKILHKKKMGKIIH